MKYIPYSTVGTKEQSDRCPTFLPISEDILSCPSRSKRPSCSIHRTTNRNIYNMADQDAAGLTAADLKKKRTFRKFTYRGVELDQLLDMKTEQLMPLLHCRARRRLSRGLKRKPMALIKRLRKAKKETPELEKPQAVKTHLRNMIIVPEMVGSVVGVHQGKTFNSVEIKPEMVGHYLGEFSITYKPVKHGRPGIGATHSSRFIPLK
ncbi:unnamed protein product [Adineta ricciae]|uniref:40S ribosomal protein S15 n=2 Tax=Adineta ricciae TaxID=249248 RepID=A0A815BMA4_ADIRI|nr:unnamed protein product [Adineta ricciae]